MTDAVKQMPRTYRFHGFEVDTLHRRLLCRGRPVALTSKAFDVLCALIVRRHETVSKDALIEAVWPRRVVEENNVPQAIAALRRAFGTDGNDRQFIVTVPGQGYRFVAELEEEPEPAPAPSADSRPRERERPAPRWPQALLLALVAATGVAWLYSGSGGADVDTGEERLSLAVLPFGPAEPGQRDEAAELGLADALAARLARSPSLQVSATESARRAASGREPLQAARRLGVDYVLAGTIGNASNELRVDVRLVSADDARVVWSRTFRTAPDDLFMLPQEIGAAVASALAVSPGAIAGSTDAPCEGSDSATYRDLIRALYRLQSRHPSTVDAFQQVIRRDPGCSRAYAGLAVSYLFAMHNDAEPEELLPLARAAAMRAIDIAPESAAAHMARGRQLQLGEWDWAASEAEHRRAIALNPDLSETRFALAHLLVTTGRFEEGLAEARRARELDPLSPLLNALEGGFLGAAGRPVEARARIENALDLEPGFWIALLVRGGLALDAGDPAAALADLEQAAERSGRASQVLAVLAFAYVANGRRARAEALLDELRSRPGYVPPINLAAVHLALGDRGRALDALEQAHRRHDIRMAFLGVDARWNTLRNEPRFAAIAHAMQLPNRPASGRF